MENEVQKIKYWYSHWIHWRHCNKKPCFPCIQWLLFYPLTFPFSVLRTLNSSF